MCSDAFSYTHNSILGCLFADKTCFGFSHWGAWRLWSLKSSFFILGRYMAPSRMDSSFSSSISLNSCSDNLEFSPVKFSARNSKSMLYKNRYTSSFSCTSIEGFSAIISRILALALFLLILLPPSLLQTEPSLKFSSLSSTSNWWKDPGLKFACQEERASYCPESLLVTRFDWIC